MERRINHSHYMDDIMSGTKGKVVAITGASSGIGEATALMLAGRGAKLVLGARRSDRLEALADRIAAAGGEAAYASTDVKRRDDLMDLVKLACERYGKLDVLVSNAGIGPISAFDDLRVEDWEEMIDVNIKGVLRGAASLPQARLRPLRQRHFDGWAQDRAASGGLCGDEERGAHVDRGFAPGSRR